MENNSLPTKADKEAAYQIYKEVVLTQVLNNDKIRTAYKLLFKKQDFLTIPMMKKQIFWYFQNQKNLDFLSEENTDEVAEFKGDKRSKEYREFIKNQENKK